MSDDDDKLREEFARLRRVDARRTPSLEMLSRAPKVRPLRPAFLAVIPLLITPVRTLATMPEPATDGPGEPAPTEIPPEPDSDLPPDAPTLMQR